MVRLLTSPDVEPSVRHTTLIQLNVMLQDSAMCDYFYNKYGVDILLDTLNSCLMTTSPATCAENTIPTVGILAKLCLQFPKVRRTINDNAQAYLLLLRALFINHHNDVFKMDCAIVLFASSYAEYIVGSNQLSLPILCQKLMVPFKCESHMRSSNCSGNSLLVQLLTPSTAFERMVDSEIVWKYIRLCFANLWFGTLEEAALVKSTGDYTKSFNYYTSSSANASLTFNAELCLTKDDLQAIEDSWPAHGIAHWTKWLHNSSTHEQVNLACAAIENFSIIDSTNTLRWDFQLLFRAIERYVEVPPKGDIDEQMFLNIIHLLRSLIERGTYT